MLRKIGTRRPNQRSARPISAGPTSGSHSAIATVVRYLRS